MTNEKVVLSLEKRELVGRRAEQVRRQGQIPGVVYGKNVGPFVVQAPAIEVQKVIRQVGRRQPVEIELDGKKRTAIIKSISRDPASNMIENVAFHAVKQNEIVVTEVPVVLEGAGESAAERAGLVVLQAVEHLEVRALPKNLPEELTVSTLGLESAGQHVTVADVVLPEGVELEAEDMEVVIASVYEPAALQAANDAAGGDAESEEDVAADNGSEGLAETGDTKEK